MAILEEKVFIFLNSRTIWHYENLKYNIPREYNKSGQLRLNSKYAVEVAVSDLAIGSHVKLTKVCDFCGKSSKKPQPYKGILEGRKLNGGYDRCQACARKKSAETRWNNIEIENSLFYKYPEIAKEWHPLLNNNLTPKDVTYSSAKYAWWKCKECCFEWTACVYSRTYYNTSCRQCNESKGERKVREYLDENKYIFRREHEFENLVGLGGSKLRYDFAIFDKSNNLNCLIEYDGEFHFKKQYENDGHEKIVIHDSIKTNYCIANNIPLIRIPYWEFDNIENILQKELGIVC